MAEAVSTLPHWDMTVVYPGLDSPEFKQGFQAFTHALDELADLFDREGIAQQEAAPLDEATVRRFEAVIAPYNAILDQVATLRAYINGFVSTDSRDELAQARMSELRLQMVRLSTLGTRFVAWIGGLDVEALIARSSGAADHAYMLRRAAEQARHLMPPAEEELAAELNVTGQSAWRNLYGSYSSQLLVPVTIDGETRELPMSAVRNLAYDPDRDVRRRAYEAELAAWTAAKTPIAAALNSIKGETNALARRRHWESPLDESLFDNNIDRQTLDAMFEAMHESFPDFRRYLNSKARALGLPKLAWYDLFAPVGASTKTWPYEEGMRFVAENFGSYSDKMRGLAERALRENWIDAEPRAGKRGGAFCMRLRPGESRILTNYEPAFNHVSTLAHELGHAYHNLNLAARTPLQQDTPMTLAETASTFCETIVTEAALEHADRDEQIAILEESLQGACQIVVDIYSRFLFERGTFEQRQQRELSAGELCRLMLDAQRQTYGDGLDGDTLHPYMWAAKPHYYSSTFYNYPYAFGLLFGLGLYARYKQDPEGFKADYDQMLSSTGLDDAASLAARFGIDIRTPDFWRGSLDVIRDNIARFERLIGDA
jgi:pepF/M3 family oligoendopeptidase